MAYRISATVLQDKAHETIDESIAEMNEMWERRALLGPEANLVALEVVDADDLTPVAHVNPDGTVEVFE